MIKPKLLGSEKDEACGIVLYRRNLKPSRATPSEKPKRKLKGEG